METMILILVSILPAVLLLWYFEKQDKGRPEPRKLKWKIFRWGLIATIIAIAIELNFEDLWAYLNITNTDNFWLYITLTAFITSALTEEALKFWIVKKNVFGSKYFDEVMDGITYAIIASLGFATVENIFYVLDGGLGVGIIRSVLSVPAHALFSGIMGYYIGKAHFQKTPWEARAKLWKGFLIAMAYHGTFNFLLFTGTLASLLVIPLMAVMWIHLRAKIREARFEDHVANEKPPEIFTIKRIATIAAGIIAGCIGLIGIIGATMLIKEPGAIYSYSEIAAAYIGFATLLYFAWYLITPPKSSS